jgi:uncharacterized protein YrzB (UPF0473 family)
MEEREDIIVMVDENGEEEEFEFLDNIEMEGNEYVVLMPYTEEDTDDEAEVVILKVLHDENGEDTFVNIEDEDELDSVFEQFKFRMEDEYEFN